MILSGGVIPHLCRLHHDAGLSVNEAAGYVIHNAHRLVNVSAAGALALCLAEILGSWDIVVGTRVPLRDLVRIRQGVSLAPICNITRWCVYRYKLRGGVQLHALRYNKHAGKIHQTAGCHRYPNGFGKYRRSKQNGCHLNVNNCIR